MGYVTKDREDVAELVVASMVEDGLSLRKASARHQISPQTFLRAVAASPALAEQYDRARATMIERLADEVMELADAPVAKLDNGATDPGMVRHRQLQVDTRKWFLSKLAPKIYGDRLDVQVSDTRISISGALAAAQARLVDVVDVTHRALPGIVQDVQSEDDVS
jgi:lambda repressor-like predicted transcriptional regulator